jgi:hypothetical protein
MPDDNAEEPLVVEIGADETLSFETPDELRRWISEERSAWDWINVYPPITAQIHSAHEAFISSANTAADEWKTHAASGRKEYASRARQQIRSIFSEYYKPPRILWRGSPGAIFINQLRANRGDEVAAGAYSHLVTRPRNNAFPPPDVFEGLITGYLFERNIDWTARAHQEALNRLKKTYAGNISAQETQLRELVKRNTELNANYDATLQEKRSTLENLHVEQSEAFRALVERYDAELKSIEQTYDQKLALQKPVQYWEEKQREHAKSSKTLGWATALAALVSSIALTLLVYWTFADVAPDQPPQHWQLGILAAAVFFIAWLIRVLLRLFFSHVHLAGDAAERRTMVLTYLALAREGADVAPEDRKLILQHLFRSAADGLVKDDATPPGVWEVITRSR